MVTDSMVHVCVVIMLITQQNNCVEWRPRDFRDDFLTPIRGLMPHPHRFPDVFFVNFALAHSLSVELQSSDNYMRNYHETGMSALLHAYLMNIIHVCYLIL